MRKLETHTTRSNRPVARRRLRRSPLSFPTGGLARVPVPSDGPKALLALPKTLIQEAAMFELIAAEARIVELEISLAEARALAIVDPLTGALNRRGFAQAGQRELTRSLRNGAPLAVAHIDLDDFKRLNDSFGHLAGDQALVQLVELLQKSMRPTDLLCRFGGEEFVLVFPDTALEDAVVTIARFQADFSARAVAGTGQVLTFSAGVVAHADEEAIDETIRRADAATYAAKKSGKNCVVVG